MWRFCERQLRRRVAFQQQPGLQRRRNDRKTPSGTAWRGIQGGPGTTYDTMVTRRFRKEPPFFLRGCFRADALLHCAANPGADAAPRRRGSMESRAQPTARQAYWRANLRLVAFCLAVWFACSCRLRHPPRGLAERGSRRRASSSASGSRSRARSHLHRADLLLRLAHEQARPPSTAWTRNEHRERCRRLTSSSSSVSASRSISASRSGRAPQPTGEFYVAGRGVHPVMNGMATAADWMSAASFISMAGPDRLHRLRQLRLPDGLDRRLRAAGDAACALPAQVRQVHRAGVHRRPLLLATRARIVGVVCLLVVSITYVIGQMTGVGVAFSRFLEVSTRRPALRSAWRSCSSTRCSAA